MTHENNGGYLLDLFVENPSEELHCCICLQVFRDPVQCSRGHAYCKECIHECLRKKKECPKCCQPLRSKQLRSVLVVKNLISNLSVRCPTTPVDINNNCHDKCVWVGKVNEMDRHVEHDCPFHVVLCANSLRGCKHSCRRRHLPHHLTTCPHELLRCENEGCEMRIERMNFENHCEDCPKRSIECPNECKHTAPWDEMDNHISICPLQEISCPFAVSFSDESRNCSSTCPGTMKRRDVDAHLSSAGMLSSCLMGLAASHREEKSKVARLEFIVKDLQKQNSDLRRRCNATGKVCSISNFFPVA